MLRSCIGVDADRGWLGMGLGVCGVKFRVFVAVTTVATVATAAAAAAVATDATV